MKRFLVKFHFHVAGGGFNRVEEQTRLVFAGDREEALERALRIGDEESGVVNGGGFDLEWRFVALSDLFELDAMAAGDVLFTASAPADESYLAYLAMRHETMRRKTPTFAL